MTFQNPVPKHIAHQKCQPLFTVSLHWNMMMPGRQRCVFSGIQFSWSLAPSISLFAKGWCKHQSTLYRRWVSCSYYFCMWKGLLDSNDGILEDHFIIVVLSFTEFLPWARSFPMCSYLIFMPDILWLKNLRQRTWGQLFVVTELAMCRARIQMRFFWFPKWVTIHYAASLLGGCFGAKAGEQREWLRKDSETSWTGRVTVVYYSSCSLPVNPSCDPHCAYINICHCSWKATLGCWPVPPHVMWAPRGYTLGTYTQWSIQTQRSKRSVERRCLEGSAIQTEVQGRNLCGSCRKAASSLGLPQGMARASDSDRGQKTGKDPPRIPVYLVAVPTWIRLRIKSA